MARPAPRTGTCGAAQARTRLQHAKAFLTAAELVLDDDTDPANAGVAAALAVLAGVAASDAACCAQLRKRHRGSPARRGPRCWRDPVSCPFGRAVGSMTT